MTNYQRLVNKLWSIFRMEYNVATKKDYADLYPLAQRNVHEMLGKEKKKQSYKIALNNTSIF